MVDDITKMVLEGAWRPATDLRFYAVPSEEGLQSVGEAKRAQDFLHIIKNYVDPLLERERRTTNYEDLYAAVEQIVKDETFEFANPLISKAVESIKAASSYLHVGEDSHIDDNSFVSLAERAMNLIQWVVFHSLNKPMTPTGLDIVPAVASIVDELDIFTLNHDKLLERKFAQDNIAFSDGFANEAGSVRLFERSWNDPKARVRLLKLHGSINWYLCRFGEWDQYASVEGNPDHVRDAVGTLLRPLGIEPVFLG